MPSQANQQAENTVRLIEQLASDRFAVRERATEQLIMLGLPAIPQLERALRSENREVRHRSQLVLLVVHELDFHHRLKSFEEDADGDKSYGLPGWERFRDLAGNTTTSRALFVQMQKAERELLGAESQAAEDAVQILERRCQRLHNSVQIFATRHELPPIAAVLFVATNQDIPLHRSTNTSLMILCQQNAFENGINSKMHQSILRNLLAAWILRKDAVPAHELMLLALQHNIVQVLPRARLLAKQPAQVDPYDRYYSVLCLAKFGGIDDVARLEAILADEKVTSRYRLNNMTYTVEMRDLVLAALLKLTEREPSAFGYSRLRLQEPLVFDTQSLGFVNDEDRQVAIAKWRIYRMRPEGR
ncbi:MAG TPA: hypothetical protein QF564_32610 [Pirellulaceae bacterium]|nr:hypothetical protein [Pirellulaceae bacterium]